MLKRYFISFLGSVSGFWVAIMLAGFSFFAFIAILISMADTTETQTVSDGSILYLNLSGEIVDFEKSPDIMAALQGEDATYLSLRDIVQSLDAAAKDDRIKGLYIECNGASCGLANSQAITDAIDRFKQSGKWSVAYSNTYSQGDYFIACHADSVLLNPIGTVDIHGLATAIPFFKGLLDKLGVEMQIVKVGTYKSAVEPYMLTEMSDASREQTEHFLGRMWEIVKENIAKERGLQPDDIDTIANSYIGTRDAQAAIDFKLVDGLYYWHQLNDLLCEFAGVDDVDELCFVTPAQYCADKDFESGFSFDGFDDSKTTIALLYAVGDIVDSGDEGIVGPTMVDQILEIAKNDDIDALVLRVNSPGGSAFASEQIWEALQEYKSITGKPFYVSMSDYAASGGYYISCGADKIYAEPLTLTGSIGIFGMIPCIEGTLSDHLGVNVSTVETNPGANFPSLYKAMSEPQKASLQDYVARGYDLFTSRVAEGRNIPQDSVKAIAEGRVWDGRTAYEIGLVDELGGLDKAIAGVADELGVNVEDIAIDFYPKTEKKWWEQFIEYSTTEMKARAIADELDPQTLQVYRALRRVQQMSGPQCRMETVILF